MFAESSEKVFHVQPQKQKASRCDLSQCDLFDIERPYPPSLIRFPKADLSMYFQENIHVIKPDLKPGLKILVVLVTSKFASMNSPV